MGIGIGIVIAVVSQPYWIKIYREQRVPFWEKGLRAEKAARDEERRLREEKGEDVTPKVYQKPEPEARLLIGMAGAVLVPIGTHSKILNQKYTPPID